MGYRREERLPLRVPAIVSGMDRHGKLFVQRAQTVDISSLGARLEGLCTDASCPIEAGAIIGVQHGDNKARFEVLWVGVPNTDREGQVGIRCIEVGQQVRKTLLCVDDSESDREAQRGLLSTAGYEILACENAAQALEEMGSNVVSVIVVDHPLPDMGTESFLQQAKQLNPQVRTVVLSAFPATLPEWVVESCDTFLHKGAVKTKLVGAVEELIGPGTQLKWPLTRFTQRHAVSVPLCLTVLRHGKKLIADGQIEDLSENGVCARLDKDLLAGEIVRLHFSLPTSPQELAIQATVRHRNRDRYGIEFVTLTREQRQAVRSLCEILPPLDEPIRK